MKSIPTLVFDFDGTVAHGNGPVLAYALALSRDLAAPEWLARTTAALTAGDTDPDALDGYDLIARAARRAGATEDMLAAAYTSSREVLGTGHAPVRAPEGLRDFLQAAAPRAELILATNAPATRIPETLDRLGLGALFDRVLTSVGKPAGLAALITELGQSPLPARFGDAVRGPGASIGDIWINDLAPAARHGWFTALIGPAHPGADLDAPTLEALLPGLDDWLRNVPTP